MKFIINTTNMQTGGALQVSLSLLQEWRAEAQHEYHVFLSPQMNELIRDADYPDFFHFYRFTINPTHSLWTAMTFGRRLRRLEAVIEPDAVLTVFGPALWTPVSTHIAGFANGYYLFDGSDYIQKKVCISTYERCRYYLRRSLLLRQLRKEASCWWVETDLARNRLLSAWNDRSLPVTVIGNTYGSAFVNTAVPDTFDTGVFTLLCLTAYYPHKNLELLRDVVPLLLQEGIACRFIVTLPDAVYRTLFTGFTAYVENIGPQHPEQLPSVYARANAVFIPTLLETFSAAYPEAMKMGKPILTSDLDFAREVCGDSALYFDPYAAADVMGKIRLLMNDVPLQQQCIASGYTRLAAMETPGSRARKLLALLTGKGKETAG